MAELIRRQAAVQLRLDAVQRLAQGKTVSIRLEDIELQLSFDPRAQIGHTGTLEDMIANALHRKSS
jgi:hypothetical protein